MHAYSRTPVGWLSSAQLTMPFVIRKIPNLQLREKPWKDAGTSTYDRCIQMIISSPNLSTPPVRIPISTGDHLIEGSPEYSKTIEFLKRQLYR
jgi:hypothetical protein